MGGSSLRSKALRSWFMAIALSAFTPVTAEFCEQPPRMRAVAMNGEAMDRRMGSPWGTKGVAVHRLYRSGDDVGFGTSLALRCSFSQLAGLSDVTAEARVAY